MTSKEFTARLKLLRSRADMTQLDLANNIEGMSQGYIGLIESGKKSPTISTLNKLADGLNISLSDLFGDRTDYDESIQKVIYFTEKLTPVQREEMVKLMKILLNLAKEEGQ